jgi:hypothetical protein
MKIVNNKWYRIQFYHNDSTCKNWGIDLLPTIVVQGGTYIDCIYIHFTFLFWTLQLTIDKKVE